MTGAVRSVVRQLVAPAAAAAMAFCMLVGLGVWQVHRLAWKDELIAEIEARMKAPPEPLPAEADWPKLVPDAYEYRHVSAQGTFDATRQALVYRPDGVGPARERGPGFLVMTPLRLRSGGEVIVDRGYVPADQRERVRPSAGGDVVITGLMRRPEPRNVFTPADDPARNQWFTRDPAAIGASFGLSRVAPFSVDADATSLADGWPVGSQTVTAIPNDHFAYAVTWFGLAATLVGVFGAYAFAQLKAARPSG